jgi:hypothetical protein
MASRGIRDALGEGKFEEAMTAAGLTWHHAGAKLSKKIAKPGFI